MKTAGRSLSCISALGIAVLAAAGASAQPASAPESTPGASGQPAPPPPPATPDKSGAPSEKDFGSGWMMGPGMMMHGGMWGGRFDGPCDPRAAGMAEWRIDQIERVVQLTEPQRAALAALRTASAEAARGLRSACPHEVPQTSVQRMAFMEKRMEAMLSAIKTVRPAFEAFYGTLTDEQKARLDYAGPHRWGWHWRWWRG